MSFPYYAGQADALYKLGAKQPTIGNRISNVVKQTSTAAKKSLSKGKQVAESAYKRLQHALATTTPKPPKPPKVKLSQEGLLAPEDVAAAGGAEPQQPSLGDPNFWGGQTPEEMGGAPTAAGSAEEAVELLPAGTFQGLNTKVTPDGQRSTQVKVSPDALSSPDALQAMFQAEPGVKVEVEQPEQPVAAPGAAGAVPNALPAGGGLLPDDSLSGVQ